jgi:hypothetical protein
LGPQPGVEAHQPGHQTPGLVSAELATHLCRHDRGAEPAGPTLDTDTTDNRAATERPTKHREEPRGAAVSADPANDRRPSPKPGGESQPTRQAGDRRGSERKGRTGTSLRKPCTDLGGAHGTPLAGTSPPRERKQATQSRSAPNPTAPRSFSHAQLGTTSEHIQGSHPPTPGAHPCAVLPRAPCPRPMGTCTTPSSRTTPEPIDAVPPLPFPLGQTRETGIEMGAWLDSRPGPKSTDKRPQAANDHRAWKRSLLLLGGDIERNPGPQLPSFTQPERRTSDTSAGPNQGHGTRDRCQHRSMPPHHITHRPPRSAISAISTVPTRQSSVTEQHAEDGGT